MDQVTQRASFSAMEDGKPDDWAIIGGSFMAYARELPDRVLNHLRLLDGDFGGFPIDRLQHSLQTATRAHRAGESEDYVVMALIHDIGDTLASYNHPDIGAAILKPFVDEKLHWIAAQHGIFQGYYFFHFLGLDRNMRDAYRDHPYYEDTRRFSELYDQAAFDPAYKSESLEFFEPMLRRVLSAPRQSLFAGTAGPGTEAQQ
jgi:predicted HD phosphohydrolase